MKSHARARLVHTAITAATASALSWATLAGHPRTVAGQTADAQTAVHAIAHPAALTAVTGGAWHADETPIPNARLRLRSVTTGKVTQMTVSNASGEFSFVDVPLGTYIVELLSADGKILGISGVVAVHQRGESIATFVRETPRRSSLGAIFTNAAAAVSAAAASTGITALSPDAMRPASPQK